jgi:hypothetical protein
MAVSLDGVRQRAMHRACGKGMVECREGYTGTGAEECNGLVVGGHCGGWLMVL